MPEEDDKVINTPYNDKNILISYEELTNLLKKFNITNKINDINLYRKAFVNKSYCTRKNENFINGNINCPEHILPLQEESNERLEFLGDSILSMVVAGYLYERYPDNNEGFLTRLRTKLVNGKMLAYLSAKIGLAKYIIISKQIEENDGRKNLNILEDVFEAFIAAVYLDFGEQGFDIANQWIVNIIETTLDMSELIIQNTNYKDIVIKYFQQTYGYIPRFYEVSVDSISKTYTVCLKDDTGNVISLGSGPNKKMAENICAKNAIDQNNIGINGEVDMVI
jgi:ribonuclease-3